MRSNFIQLSSVVLVLALVVILVLGGAGGQVTSAATVQATQGGTMSAGATMGMMACPSGSTTASAGMMATMSAQMMATMGSTMQATMGATGTASSSTRQATMGATGTMQATMAGTMAALAMQQMPMTSDMMNAGCLFSVNLTGPVEVPPGAAQGTGNAIVLVNSQQEMVCYDFTGTKNIKLPAIASHIHQAAVGVAGPVVVPFGNPPDANGVSSGCVTNVPGDIIMGILTNPANYYVNVHTTDFPAGAIRGQLTGGK